MNPLVLTGAFELGKKLLDRFFPDPVKRAEAELELVKMKESGDLARLASFTELAKAQIGLNTEEVKSGHWLGKWRGALGWGLVASMLYQFILFPFLVAILLALDHTFPVERLPKLDWKQLGSVLLGMLGLA
jgi:hypothetical protein